MKYGPKDSIIEAFRFHAGNGPQDWPEGWLNIPHSILGDGVCTLSFRDGVSSTVRDGSWIVKDSDGSIFSLSDELFRSIYEPVES